MLYGQYEAKLSKKNQFSFPKKFREELGRKLIFTKGLEGYLIVIAKEQFEVLLEGSENKPFIDRDARELQRFLLGNASETELDAKGRCVLPEYLKEFAHLQEDIVVVGIRKFVEIWDKKTWLEQQKAISGRVEEITKRLTEDRHDK